MPQRATATRRRRLCRSRCAARLGRSARGAGGLSERERRPRPAVARRAAAPRPRRARRRCRRPRAGSAGPRSSRASRCSLSPRPIAGAVTSGGRRRCGSGPRRSAEKPARASPSLALGISRSKWADGGAVPAIADRGAQHDAVGVMDDAEAPWTASSRTSEGSAPSTIWAERSISRWSAWRRRGPTSVHRAVCGRRPRDRRAARRRHAMRRTAPPCETSFVGRSWLALPSPVLLWSRSEATARAAGLSTVRVRTRPAASVIATTAVAIDDRRRARRRPRGRASCRGGTARSQSQCASERRGAASRFARSEAARRPGRPARWRNAGNGDRAQRAQRGLDVKSRRLSGSIACLPQLVDDSVQLGAGVRLRDPDARGRPRRWRGRRRTSARPAPGRARRVLPARWRRRGAARSARPIGRRGGPRRQPGRPASVACLPRRRSSSSAALRAIPNSQARALPRRGLKRGALSVGALEGGGGDVLGRGAVAKQPGGIGVDVVAVLAVEPVEGDPVSPGGSFGLCEKSLTHAPTTGGARIHHTPESQSGGAAASRSRRARSCTGES